MRALSLKLAFIATVVGAIAGTTMSLGKFAYAQAPGGAAGGSGSGVTGTVNPSTITSVPLQCSDSGPVVLGHANCPELQAKVIKAVRTRISYFTWNYYHGKIVDQQTGQVTPSPTPVCNMNNGERDTNQFGQSCGPYCEFNITLVPPGGNPKGMPPQYCVRESSWALGGTIQELNFYKDQVIAEFQSKNVQLVDYDGTRPCAEQAADLLNLSAGRDVAEQQVIKQENAASNPSALTCGRTDGSGGDQASCLLQMSNTQLESLWDLFLMCEITRRPIKDAITKAENKDSMMADAKSEAMKCAVQVGLCLVCTDSMRSGIANSCYKGLIPGYMSGKLNQNWPISQPLEPPIQPPSGSAPNTSNGTQRDPVHRPTAPELPGGGGMSLFAMASLGSFFKKRKRFFAMSGTFTAIVFLLSAINFVTPATGDSAGCTAACGQGSGGCGNCNSCASGCASCIGCADCPFILQNDMPCLNQIASGIGPSSAAGSSGDGQSWNTSANPGNWTSTSTQCVQAAQAEQRCPPSANNQSDVAACMNQYCNGATAPSGGSSGGGSLAPQASGAGSSSVAPSAAPVASATQANLAGVAKTTGNKAGFNTGGGADTAGYMPTGTGGPAAQTKGDGGAPPTAVTKGGPAMGTATSSGGGGNGNGNGLGNLADSGGFMPDDTGSGDAATGSATAFDAAANGGGRGGGKAEPANPFGNLFGPKDGGAGPNGVSNANFGTDAAGASGGAGSDEDMLKASAGKSLFEIVNKRMDKWGVQK